MADTAANPPRLIRVREVLNLTSLSRTELYRRLADGRFPQQIRLGSRSVAWNEADIHEWVASQVKGGLNHG